MKGDKPPVHLILDLLQGGCGAHPVEEKGVAFDLGKRQSQAILGDQRFQQIADDVPAVREFHCVEKFRIAADIRDQHQPLPWIDRHVSTSMCVGNRHVM